jgi:hypothetical protein
MSTTEQIELENEILKIKIARLTKQLEAQKAEEVYNSWKTNPDRMGGQFTEEEKNDTGWH